MENFLSSVGITFAVLFPLVDPVGAIPVFCTLTSDSTSAYRTRTALKTSLNVMFVLLAFYFVGEFILEFFGISLGVLKIAGGIIVAHTAWEMLVSKDKLSDEEHKEVAAKEDISFTPMALPLLSGPGAIGAAIGLSIQGSQEAHTLGVSVGILLTSVSVLASLLLSFPLMKMLGKTGIGVLNKIMGFFILAIAVNLVASGIMMIYKP
ncbi:MAG: MarC family protein [Bacteroidetes bacterium]|nr:MarC family protein [Bacteroidota bacterium]